MKAQEILEKAKTQKIEDKNFCIYTESMLIADAEALVKDQDYEKETTNFGFEDGSCLVFDGVKGTVKILERS